MDVRNNLKALANKGWIATLLSFAFIFFLGCSADRHEVSEERRNTVIFDLPERVLNPDMWNPYIPGARRDQGLHQAMIEPLFMLNLETGEILPWLGLSMTSNPRMDVWTLELRPGVKWSDGMPFTAADVVFTVEMLIENAPSLRDSASIRMFVERVEQLDELTVRFFLTEPNPRFKLDYWAVKMHSSVYILPKHIWENKDPMMFRNYDREKGWPVFTGPYVLERVTDAEFVYRRHDNWWGAETGWKPLPEPERLIWVWYGPAETRTAAAAEGRLDSLWDVTLGAYQALGRRVPEAFVWFDGPPYAWIDPCVRALEFNHTVPPWDDPEMRWAINHAIDRDMIVAVAYEGTTQAARHFFPAYEPLEILVDRLEADSLYEKYPLTEHNPERTREILESKGYRVNRRGYYEKDGQTLSLAITTHEAFIEKQRVAQVIVEQLQNVGINASQRNEAGGTWGHNMDFGLFEAVLGWRSCGSVNEPWSSMDSFSADWYVPPGQRAQKNWWRWRNEAYSALVNEMSRLPLDDPRVAELFDAAMEFWLADLPVIPVAQARHLVVFNPQFWEGWPKAEDPYITPTVWWNNAHAIIHRLKRSEASKAALRGVEEIEEEDNNE